MFDEIYLSSLQIKNVRGLIQRLENLIDKVSADLRDAQIEIQRLRDYVNRLKGEQDKPETRRNTPKAAFEHHHHRKGGMNRACGTNTVKKQRKVKCNCSGWWEKTLPPLNSYGKINPS